MEKRDENEKAGEIRKEKELAQSLRQLRAQA
jgi:hypothetical protein